jgi:hypothetical protein
VEWFATLEEAAQQLIDNSPPGVLNGWIFHGHEAEWGAELYDRCLSRKREKEAQKEALQEQEERRVYERLKLKFESQ